VTGWSKEQTLLVASAMLNTNVLKYEVQLLSKEHPEVDGKARNVPTTNKHVVQCYSLLLLLQFYL